MMEAPIKFSAPGLPPKKDGANSMWRQAIEVARLKTLRTKALQAMDARSPYARPLMLTIRLYALPQDGDLDNFITGICDGLMAAHKGTPIDLDAWNDLPEMAKPHRSIVFLDDSYITN